jgi:hypothetical protein
MGRSLGFASTTCDYGALFRLAFASAPLRSNLTWPQTVTRRFIMQKARGHTRTPPKRDPIVLPLLVGTWFQVLLTPFDGVLFTIQSPYLFTIGRRGVLSLGWWSTRLHAEFHELYATLVPLGRALAFAYGGVTLYAGPFQNLRLTMPLSLPYERPATPRCKHPGLGSSAFARRY